MSEPTPTARRLLAIVLISASLGLLVYDSLPERLPIRHLDGVYQTFATSNRLQSGETIGRDFLPYLGIGVTYSTYPLFAGLGGTLPSSQLSATVTVKAMFIATTLFLVWATLGSVNIRLGILGAAFVVAFLVPLCAFAPQWDPLGELCLPGNSLRPARSFIAIYAAFAFWLAVRHLEGRPLATGLLSSVMPIWSNDYGYVCFVLFHLFVALHGQERSIAITARRALAAVGIGIGGSLLLLLLATRGAAADYLAYCWRGVAADQFWYFGSYGRHGKYFTITDLLGYWRRPSDFATVGLLAYPLVLIYAPFERNLQRAAIVLAGSAMFLSALATEIGGHRVRGYYAGALYVGVWLLVLALLSIASRAGGPGRAARFFAQPGRKWAAVLFLFAALLPLHVRTLQGARARRAIHLERVRAAPPHDRLGWVVPIPIAADVAAIDEIFAKRPGALVSENYSWVDLLSPSPSRTRVDSIIHALGTKERSNFLDALVRPETRYAVTTKPSSTHWQAWSLHQNWSFYRTVIEEFRPIHVGETVVLWERDVDGHAGTETEAASCVVMPTGRMARLHVIGRPDAIYDVEITYRVAWEGRRPLARRQVTFEIERGPGSKIGGSLRFTIDPRKDSARIPMISGAGTATATMLVEPTELFSVEVTSCQARFVAPTDPSFVDLGESIP